MLGWGAGLAFCLYWLVSLCSTPCRRAGWAGYTEASASVGDVGFLAFLSTAIVAPVVEEVIFRGLIYTRLQRAMDERWAMVVSAAAFGVCHGELVWFCYAFVLGLIFAQLTRYTGSILPAMVMHVVFNATNQLLLLVADAEIGIALFLVILLLATGGTAFCAIQVRAAVLQMPRPAAQPEPPQSPERHRTPARPAGEHRQRSPAPPGPRARPGTRTPPGQQIPSQPDVR